MKTFKLYFLVGFTINLSCYASLDGFEQSAKSGSSFGKAYKLYQRKSLKHQQKVLSDKIKSVPDYTETKFRDLERERFNPKAYEREAKKKQQEIERTEQNLSIMEEHYTSDEDDVTMAREKLGKLRRNFEDFETLGRESYANFLQHAPGAQALYEIEQEKASLEEIKAAHASEINNYRSFHEATVYKTVYSLSAIFGAGLGFAGGYKLASWVIKKFSDTDYFKNLSTNKQKLFSGKVLPWGCRLAGTLMGAFTTTLISNIALKAIHKRIYE